MPAPPNPPFIAAASHGGAQSVIKRIVIHGTVSPTQRGGARNIARFFAGGSSGTSAHYVVDPYEEIQCVGDHTIAWHDGTNSNSIGVEMCDPVEGPLSRWNEPEHQLLLKRTASLVRQLCLAYGIPMRRLTPAQIRAGQKGICGHVDMRDAFPGSTSHWDPGAFPWSKFISLVNNGAGSINTEDELPTPKDVVDAWNRSHPYLNREDLADYILNKSTAKDWAGNAQSVNGRLNNMDHRIYDLCKDMDEVKALLRKLADG